MRNPALHLVGIAASPGGGGLFGTRAEEELRQWLEQRLDALGIDPVAYSRFVLSFLRHPDSALTPPLDTAGAGKCGGTNTVAATVTAVSGRRSKARPRSKLPLQGDKEQRRAVVQCLKNAADQKCGVETLVDELCVKLKDLEGGHSKDQQEESITATDAEAKVPFETLSPRDRALRYYAAFPALQPVTTPKKFPNWKERNFNHDNSSNNNNNNNYYCNNNNNNNNNNKNNYNSHNCNNKKNISKSNTKNKNRQKRNKIAAPAELQFKEDKEDLEFGKTMERKKEEQELALDELRLAQLQAKFDESLEALWDTGPGISRGSDSIWAAPSLSILSGPSWPTENVDRSFPSVTLEENSTLRNSFHQKLQPVDDSPIIPRDVDLFNIEDNLHESTNKKNSSQMNICWSNSIRDNSWYWEDLNNVSINHSPGKAGFFPVIPCNNTVAAEKELRFHLQKIPNLPEPDEDLLTSARTHFRPIKEDGNWADGTTFPVNNTLERVAYRRSDSGNLLYLPGGESPYMEYRENLSMPVAAAAAVPSNLTLKFRVHQCDKSIQTEPIRSPVKRRILSEQDHLYYSLNTDGEIHMNDNDEIEKDSFNLDHVDWTDQPLMLLKNERKRRHGSNFKARSMAVLRPLTL